MTGFIRSQTDSLFDQRTGALLGQLDARGREQIFPTTFGIKITDTFDAARANMTAQKDYAFGTANAPAGAVSIPDLATLATYFNAFEDFTGLVTINSEVQRYQPFNAQNHVFTPLNLNLTALGTVPAAIVTQNNATGPALNGTATPIANLGLASTAGLFVGQMVAVEFKGIYYISALVANTSVSLTSLGGSTTAATGNGNNLTVFLPWCYATVSVAGLYTDTSITLSSVPSGLTVGMHVGMTTGTTHVYDRRGTATVSSIVGNVVSFTGDTWMVQDPGVGQGIVFGPAITSGQIWSKDTFDLAGGGYQAIAFELEADAFPGANGGYDINKLNTAALYASMPSDVAVGYWPAFWLYSADTAGGSVINGATSEIDIVELFNSFTMGPRCWTGNNVVKLSPGQGANWFVRLDSGDSASGQGGSGSVIITRNAARPLNGTHKFQMIWTPRQTYRYLDGVLLKADDFYWTSANPAQIGINLAMGSLLSNYGANVQFPLTPQAMNNAQFGIRRLRVWAL